MINKLKEIALLEQTFNFKTNAPIKFSLEGLSEKNVRELSAMKNEPEWMLDLRLKAFRHFMQRKMPSWGPDLSKINFNEIKYFIKPKAIKAREWKKVPKEIKETFERLNLPEIERKALAGSIAQFESESVYLNLKKEFEEKGIIFVDLDTALQEYPELVKKYFMSVVPFNDNKFSALHYAFWSGGSFVFVPKNTEVILPLQTYFRMNAAKEGQFEHTLIIAEENSKVHYIEGCTAPKYPFFSLHSAVVEIQAMKNSKVRYTTIQNWSKNIFNLNTKRAIAHENASVEWISGSLGSFITMLYPSTILKGNNSSAFHLNIAFAPPNTWKDGGAKIIHVGKNTKSNVIAKSISFGNGTSVYRGLIRINKGAKNAFSHVQCDALLLDEKAVSLTFPHNEVLEKTAFLSHEASISRISKEKLFYLMSRGLNEMQAKNLIVLGFLSPLLKELPLEFAVEFKRLIEIELERFGGIG